MTILPIRRARLLTQTSLAFAALLANAPISASEPPPGAGPIVLRSGLFVDRVTSGGRELIRTDPLAYAMNTGSWLPPTAESTVTLPDGRTAAWKQGESDADGKFDPALGRGGYGFLTLERTKPSVMVLEANAHAMVYVNGEPRMGDPYGHGIVGLPVQLRAGTNEFLFAIAGRGPFAASLRPARAAIELDTRDITAPDLIRGETSAVALALPLRNTTVREVQALIEYRLTDDDRWQPAGSCILAPLSIAKTPVHIRPASPAAGDSSVITLRVRVADSQGVKIEGEPDTAEITLQVRDARELRKLTYTASPDESIQYYAVVPPAPGTDAGDARHGLVLSLHGASVEATGQASSYAAKDDLWIVCPTNRRPFGFDWESWGRVDGLEVLSDFTQRFTIDPTRIYLTGHSMGGHGSWQFASLFPDRFAAVAPSAGWISFSTYGGQPPPEGDAVRRFLTRGTSTSDTLAMVRNLSGLGVYIIHGDADDNVPISEARKMAEVLGTFHKEWKIHEEPGAGHWWDSGEWGSQPGAACVDFPPAFTMFGSRRIPAPADVDHVDFTTLNPAVSSRCSWITILRQERRLAPSSVELTRDPASQRITGTTSNVASLMIERGGSGAFSIELDGKSIAVPAGTEPVVLTRASGDWSLSIAADRSVSPPPPGTGAAAFDGFTFIIPTGGTAVENATTLALARFLAEQWWYRGNGFARIIRDLDWLKKHAAPDAPAAARITLFGNADINLAWRDLIPETADAPRLTRSGIRVGDRSLNGSLAMIALHRTVSGGTVGLVGGTDLPALRTLERLPVFVSGVGIPEIVIIRPEFIRDGAAGLVGAGFLTNDGSTRSEDWIWPGDPSQESPR